jgi:hypothetical protein
MKNRNAWGIISLLAAVLIGGGGMLLVHGVHVGCYGVQLRGSWEWRLDRGLALVLFAPNSQPLQITRSFHLGYLRLQVTTPAPHSVSFLWKASRRSGTAGDGIGRVA